MSGVHVRAYRPRASVSGVHVRARRGCASVSGFYVRAYRGSTEPVSGNERRWPRRLQFLLSRYREG